MTRYFAIPTAMLILCVAGARVFGQTRPSIGSAFERNYKAPRPSPSPELNPEDRKRLVNEVSSAYYADAVKAKKAGRLAEALKLFDRVVALEPGNQAARDQATETRRSLEVRAKAQKTPARSSSSRALSRLWSQAEAAARAQKWDEAETLYQKILALEPDNKRARAKQEFANAKLFARLKTRGEQRERAGDMEGALAAYQMALTHGEDQAVLNRIGVLKRRLSDSNRKKSEQVYVEALSATQQGDDKKARDLCEQALKLDPSNIEAQRMFERLEKRPH